MAFFRQRLRAFAAVFLCALAAATAADSLFMNSLTPDEARVMLRKGTEPPFSGKYDNFFENGVYACRQCGAALYRSTDKFDAGCGWPAFDDAVAGAVRRIPDADGRRVEIVCARCGGHLGHVFEGEKLTKKDTRHCVNSLSLAFVPAAALGRVVVAGGCFWGVEALMRAQKGVLDVVSGYAGPRADVPPTYARVCAGDSGYTEAVEVRFDRRVVDVSEILKRFFEIHDFTQANGQGPDIGAQYLSKIFYADAAQAQAARALLARLRALGYAPATQLEPLRAFYPAEDAHQRYYERTGKRPYCHRARTIF